MSALGRSFAVLPSPQEDALSALTTPALILRIIERPRRWDKRPIHWYWIIPILYFIATITLLWPLVAHLRSGVGDTEGDPLLNTWTLRWVQHTMLSHPAHLYDGNMFGPNPRTIAFSELLLPQAIMAWPVWLLSHDSLLAYNLSVLVTYPLCAVFMYALCRALNANRGAAFLAGLLFAFAPFRIDNNAHLQVLSMQWMPLAMLAMIRLIQQPTKWRALAVTATTALIALSSIYYAVMFATALLAFLVVEAVRQRRSFTIRIGVPLVIALAAAAVIVVLIDLPYLTMRDEQGITRTIDEVHANAARGVSYLTTSPGSIVWRHLLPTATNGPSTIGSSALFPGALLSLFAFLGLRSIRRPWMLGIFVLGFISFILSFGPTWGAKAGGWPLPYRLLYPHLSVYQGLRGPDRFGALVLLALGVFAATGATAAWEAVAAIRPRLREYALVCAVLISGAALVDVGTHLRPVAPVDRSAETLAPYRWLASQPDPGIIAEFPVERYEQRTAFYSTYHWQKVLWGHSGFIPAATYQLRGRFLGRDDLPGLASLDALADFGVRTLVIHRSAYTAAMLADIDTQLQKSPEKVLFATHVGDSDIYTLRPPENDSPFDTRLTYTQNAAGNVDTLLGQLTVTNRDSHARMLYTVGLPRMIAEFRDMTGKIVSKQRVTILFPAVITLKTTSIPFAVKLPREPGEYAVSISINRLLSAPTQTETTVQVVTLSTLPHLTVEGVHVTSPALYTPGEPVAMWITTKGGTTLPLPETTARDDRTIDVVLQRLPLDAAQIVAHGKESGVEIWVSPP